MSPLNPDEENLLRGLEEQLRKDAPHLAKKLRPVHRSTMERRAPTSWPPRAFVTIGIVLIVLGAVLDVGSSVMGGLLSLGLAWLRSLQLKRSSPWERSGGDQHGSPYSRS